MVLDIAHVTFSSAGGAGTVASRLADVQRETGHRAWVHSLIDNSLWANPWQRPLHTMAATIDHYAVRHPDNPSPVSLFRDGVTSRLPRGVRDADVIHVHWPHGIVGLGALAALSQTTRVVWTLHDMNPFTGVCHYSVDCGCQSSSSGDCQGVRPLFKAAARKYRARKQEFVAAHPAIHYVSPSAWLAHEAATSHVMGGLDIPVIYNPLPVSLPTVNQVLASAAADNQTEGPVFVASASELSDPMKNIGLIVSAFEKAFPADSSAQLLVIGRGAIPTRHPRVFFLGHLSHDKLLQTLSRADWLVVASLAENQPLAISEAQAMGVSLLAADRTGLPEHVDIDPGGALFQTEADLVELFTTRERSRRHHTERRTLMSAARKKFDPELTAVRYEELYRAMPQVLN